MKLIIGGAYQGKKEYALEHYPKEIIIEDFHLSILEMLKNGTEPLNYIKENISKYKDKVIICEDMSSGIVPIDPIMRKWREATGHSVSFLAKESDEVIRLFCSIPVRLK